MNHISFPSIESFHHIVKYAKMAGHLSMTYRGKIKLHGTNAGVRILNGKIVAQSRTNLLTIEKDNAGFAKFVEQNKDYFNKLPFDNCTIFGEWCGPGIMRDTAINKIPNKILAIFALQIGEGEKASLIVEPERIKSLLPETKDVYVLPWYGMSFSVNFLCDLRKIAENLNQIVSEVEPCDPWVKKIFGIEGTAEGLVYFPTTEDPISRITFENFIFKAKGDKHRVVKTKEAVQISAEAASSISDFVSKFVTEPRLEQGLSFVELDMRNTGKFLKWVSEDIYKESKDELEASNLTWDQVQRFIQTTARTWFINKVKA